MENRGSEKSSGTATCLTENGSVVSEPHKTAVELELQKIVPTRDAWSSGKRDMHPPGSATAHAHRFKRWQRFLEHWRTLVMEKAMKVAPGGRSCQSRAGRSNAWVGGWGGCGGGGTSLSASNSEKKRSAGSPQAGTQLNEGEDTRHRAIR